MRLTIKAGIGTAIAWVGNCDGRDAGGERT